MDLKKLKIPELKKELTSRGLALKGNKQELVTRLSQYLEENDESILDNGTEPTDALLTPGADEDLLEQEDEPSLLDDEEEEPAVVPATVAKVTSPVALQRKPAAAAPEPKPSVPAVTVQKIAIAAPTATALTPEQKKALRAERFNTPLSEDVKKQKRLEKFGGKPVGSASAGTVPKAQTNVSTMSLESLEKLKKRSERFGTVVSPVVQKTEEMERLLKRKQRFGVITNKTTPAVIGNKRISTEGATDDSEAKKKKRAERFGLA